MLNEHEALAKMLQAKRTAKELFTSNSECNIEFVQRQHVTRKAQQQQQQRLMHIGKIQQTIKRQKSKKS